MNNIIFFGTEEHSLISLKKLVEASFPVVVVITKPDSLKGRGKKLSSPAVKTYAESKNIPVWQPTKLSELTEQIKNLQPTTGILVSYGKIIPQSIIDLFTPGIINLHPSLLPKYRGPSPIESAILNQDSETGISLMSLSAKMDAGPVYYQQTYPLNKTENKPDLYLKLFELGSDLLIKKLPGILSGDLQPINQAEDKATYCQLLSKKDAWLDPDAQTANEADAHIRAYLGFPGSKTTLFGHEVIITKSHPSDKPEELSILCKDGRYLVIDRLKPVGKKEIPSQAFLIGYKK